MDPALLKQRQEFMKQAIKSMDTMKQIKSDGQNQHNLPSSLQQAMQQKKKKKPPAPSASTNIPPQNNFVGTGLDVQNAAANFSIMAKIVDYMKKRHLNGQHWPLSLRELLDEMQIYDVNKKTFLWLQEALPHNHRLQAESDDKFSYKPPHRVKNKVTLLALLKKQQADGKGGILLSELNECLANAEAVVKSLGNQVIAIPTQINKRKDTVYHFNDNDMDYALDEEFVQLWRVAGVEHLDENKIEEYLQKHGLESARDLQPRRTMAAGAAPKRKQPRQRAQQKVHNAHLDGVLEDYAPD